MPEKKILFDEVLNTLSDDDENIKQIEQQLDYFQIPYSKEQVKKCIDDMLENNMINIAYPCKATINEFKRLMWNDSHVEKFWFKMTAKGRSYWENIELK